MKACPTRMSSIPLAGRESHPEIERFESALGHQEIVPPQSLSVETQERIVNFDNGDSNAVIDKEFWGITWTSRDSFIVAGINQISKRIVHHAEVMHAGNRETLKECSYTEFLFNEYKLYMQIHGNTIRQILETPKDDV